MHVTEIGIIAAGSVALGLLASLRRDLRPGAALLGVAAPMSASAAAVLPIGGGASLLIATVAAGGFVTGAVFCALREGVSQRGVVDFAPAPHARAAACLLGLFVALALVGGYALPRIFEGETLVFATERDVAGVTGGAFKLPLVPLGPRAGAITQSAYLISSFGVFLTALWAARRDIRVIAAAMWGATLSTITLGALDASGWSGVGFFRTATYQIADAQAFSGFTRIIGGATEPSTFGGVAAGLAAWHLWRWGRTWRLAHGAAFIGLAVCVAASLSTTAIGAFGAAIVVFAFGAITRSINRLLPAATTFAAALIIAGGGAVMLSSAGPAVSQAFDAMFAGKLFSESGVERTAWAAQALVNFEETWGLGAGLGAAKASGWVTAILGQTGAPGAALMLAFLTTVFMARAEGEARAIKAAAATLLAAALISEARVDLGYLFHLCAAGALAGALPARRRARGDLIPNIRGLDRAPAGV